MTSKFYYIRDEKGKLLATRCLLYNGKCYDESSDVAMGLAICSPKDNFARKTGRELAYKRAIKAFHSKRNSLPIRRVTSPNVEKILALGFYHKSYFWTLGEYP
jgi:hypothetical protein